MSERANGRASGPVLQSVFLAVLDHSGKERNGRRDRYEDPGDLAILSSHGFLVPKII